MKQTQRFKRVAIAKPKKHILTTTELSNDSVIRTGHRSKSVTIKSSKPKINSVSVPIPGPSFENMTVMSLEFFQIDALELAPRLLGKFLKRDDVVLQITEVTHLFYILFVNLFLDKNQNKEKRKGFFFFWFNLVNALLFGCLL